MRFLPAAALAVAAMLLPAIAFAQETTPAVEIGGGINVMELLGMIVTAAATVLIGVITWAVQRYTGIKVEGAARKVIEDSVLWAANRAVGEIKTKIGEKLSTNSTLVDTGVQYVIDHTPDALAKLGVDIKTAEGQKALAGMVEARLSALDTTTPAVIPGQAAVIPKPVA
jgi:hypothetical protein